MIEFLTSPELWIALLALVALEIVLGVDNLVFISIAVSKLPPHQRSKARSFGLALACVTRILLLLTLAWIAGMTQLLFSLFGHGFSIRDLVLIGGGLFLLGKGAMEIHDSVEGGGDAEQVGTKPSAVFGWVVAQIAVVDIVFSLDSVVTAVGIVPAERTGIMVAAIIIAVGIMILASNPIGDFIERHPTLRMLALTFLILVGAALVADGFGYHIPRGFLYFAMAFSGLVEALKMVSRHRRAKKAERKRLAG